MDIPLSITWNTAAFAAALRALPAMLDLRRDPMPAAARSAMAEVMAFGLKRFEDARDGNGVWAPHKRRTVVSRLKTMHRQSKATGPLVIAANAAVSILYETGTLQRGLFQPGASGHFQETTATTLTEGVRGGHHPTAPMSVGQLAALHHYGDPGRNLPARPVMGPLDGTTLAAAASALTAGAAAAFNQLAASVSAPAAAAA